MMRRFARNNKPWLLEAHFVAPHDPYMPLKKHLDRYDARAIPVAPIECGLKGGFLIKTIIVFR
jgi:hypothetical protein